MKKLVILHGALGSSEVMRLIDSFLNQENELYYYNFPGHGNEQFNSQPLTIASLAASLKYFIKNKNLEQASVFGYSMGGYVALHLETAQKNTFGKIFTLGTKFNWNKEGALKEVQRMNPEIMEIKIPAYTRYLTKLHGEENWKRLVSETSNLMEDLGENSMNEKDLKSIEIPVKICVGDQDNRVSAEESIKASQLIPDGSFHLFTETVHPFEKVNHKLIAEELIKFIT